MEPVKKSIEYIVLVYQPDSHRGNWIARVFFEDGTSEFDYRVFQEHYDQALAAIQREFGSWPTL